MNNQKSHRQLPVIKKKRYYNHHNDGPESFLFQTIPSLFKSFLGRKKRLPENKEHWIAADPVIARSAQPCITWIGHATFLIQVEGINILTDPVFGSPSIFFPRILPSGISLANLPPIDFVLISHNHPDHLHIPSLVQIKKNSPHMTLLVPQGDKRRLEKQGFAVHEFTWWQTHSYPVVGRAPLIFTFLPAHHWSAYGLFDWNRSLWGSWMVGYTNGQSEQRSIYFAGDTAYAGHFEKIAYEFRSIHTALMPIGPGEPHTWMCKTHMNAAQAVRAFLDLKATHFVPMHWGTFQFGCDRFAQPIENLQVAWHAHRLQEKNKNLSIVKVGQRLIL